MPSWSLSRDHAARPSECLHFQRAGASFYAEGEWVEAAEAYGEAATALQVNDLQVALRRPALDLIIACWLNQAQPLPLPLTLPLPLPLTLTLTLTLTRYGDAACSAGWRGTRWHGVLAAQ